jgi:hypothetical protein
MSDKPIPPSVAEHALQTCLRENGEQIGMAATIAQQAELIRLQEDKIQRQAAELSALKMPGAALKWAGVVLPDRAKPGNPEALMYVDGWNRCIEEVTRINASRDVAARDLLQRIVTGEIGRHVFDKLATGQATETEDGKTWLEAREWLAAAPSPAPDHSADDLNMAKAHADVLAERKRQVEKEGWSPDHDDDHREGQMATAGGLYAQYAFCSRDLMILEPPMPWPWHSSWWKPTTPRRNLIKAAALILAEIERIDRALLAGG